MFRKFDLEFMIKVLKEGIVPTAEITCPNCNSLLEYGNTDLWENTRSDNWFHTSHQLRCYKSSKLKADGMSYTKVVCAIQRDIFTRMGNNEPIAQRTIDICMMRDCPYRHEHRPRKHNKIDSPNLFTL